MHTHSVTHTAPQTKVRQQYLAAPTAAPQLIKFCIQLSLKFLGKTQFE